MNSMRRMGVLVVGIGLCCGAYGQSSLPGQNAQSSLAAAAESAKPEPQVAADSSLYVKVQLSDTVKVSALKPGDVVEGKLAQDVYSGDRELFAAGARVRLTVDKLERRRRVPNDHWPWVVKAFTPRHENYPTFQSAAVSLPDGKEAALRVSLIFINRETEVRAQVKKKKVAHPDASAGLSSSPNPSQAKDAGSGNAGFRDAGFRNRGPFVTLQAENPTETVAGAGSNSSFALPGPVTLAAGTRAKIILLGGVSASKSRPGDRFQARLVEPVRLDSRVVLPEGTLLGGKVVRSTPPRMLSRSGSLLLTFTELTLPGGTGIPAAASITAAELDQRSHTKIDPEGKLHGDRPGTAWMLINAGVTAGIAKEADDATQLLVEALVSTATDASTAGTAKIVAACASGVFMLTRHGRDVILPQFTEMDIVFDRPVSLYDSRAVPDAR
jgi:hypothetical protein